MKKVMRWLILICLFTYLPIYLSTCLYCEIDSEIYFNSGIDKYVKGDYDGAIALFEQTLSLSPNHTKAKRFLKKVLIEGTEKQIMKSNSWKADIYIKRAKELFPDDEKVNELQKIIKGMPITGPPQQTEGAVGTVKNAVPKKKVRPVTKKKIKKDVKKTEEPVVIEQVPLDNEKNTIEQIIGSLKEHFLVLSITSGLILFALIFICYIWIKKKVAARRKELEDKIRAEEEAKFRKEMDNIKKNTDSAILELKREMAEKAKIQMAEKKTVTEKAGETARQRFEATIEEEKTLNTISDELKKEEYSKQIIQKMTLSIKTIMNVNREEAVRNILRLAKSPQPGLRYDCVKIIDSILNMETFEILLGLIKDSDIKVKKAAIVSVNNICKISHPAIPSDMISKAQKLLNEEKTRNGWIM
ncbi:MAG: hypothetical protein JW983_05615 [Elusimicrobia bacterium]|nr:hypothetical protein [Elusimicrobiota bacterium]